MPLEIVRNDITKMKVDAIVNTANPMVTIGVGVDEAIYRAAGIDELFEERKKIGKMKRGEVAVTPAFNLDANYIIHTVGPVWDEEEKSSAILSLCYRDSLIKAKELECESIAFPLIASGAYSFPKEKALKIAINEISSFLFENEMTVYLVVYDKESFQVSGKLFNDIASYIDENEVSYSENSNHKRRQNILSSISFGKVLQSPSNISANTEYDEEAMEYDAASNNISIDEYLKLKDETFQEFLFRLIDRKGMDEVEVYKKANIDRKHFSKIRSNANYQPTKKTALAFAIALGLSLDETKDLLLRAGIALTRSSTFDLIIEYCIEHKITDINEINCILFEYNQPTLGI